MLRVHRMHKLMQKIADRVSYSIKDVMLAERAEGAAVGVFAEQHRPLERLARRRADGRSEYSRGTHAVARTGCCRTQMPLFLIVVDGRLLAN